MNLMKLSEYEELKGEISDKSEAFEKGQIVAYAYMADCMGCSLAFNGMEELVKKIESGRKPKGKSFEEWKAVNSDKIEELAEQNRKLEKNCTAMMFELNKLKDENQLLKRKNGLS